MIPNRFHFVFGLKPQTLPFHLAHYLCLASCLATQQPDAVYFYYHHEPFGRYWELVRDELVLVKIPCVRFIEHYRHPNWSVGRYRYAHAPDFVGLEKLVSHGGVYADMDTLFVNPIPHALHEKPFVLGREDDIRDPVTHELRPFVCNAFVMAERNAPFGRMWFEKMQQASDGSSSNHLTLLPNVLAQQHPGLIHLEPARTFYKHTRTREGLHTLLAGLDTDNEGVVSFHLWSHLWWSRRQRDFCRFHAGKLTEEFVRNVDTTYNVVARNYLPPRETRSFFMRQTASVKRQIERLQGAAREVGMKAFIFTKLVAFSILKENVFPRATEHLDYAQRQWKHPEVRTRFQARNRFEQQLIFDDVALRDSYGIEKMLFAPDDVVVDIGAHVGIFSYMCYRRGSRSIHAYEAEIENFERLARFVGDVAGIFPYHLAVFRSDQKIVDGLSHSGYPGDNTGGGTVLFRGQTADFELQAILDEPNGAQSTYVISLDDILKQFTRVRLLKLDCEGSEFPILLTSQLLERVEQILGEYHEIEPALYARLDPAAQFENYSAYRVEHLVARLEQCGFQVCVRAHTRHIGFFTATRTRNAE